MADPGLASQLDALLQQLADGFETEESSLGSIVNQAAAVDQLVRAEQWKDSSSEEVAALRRRVGAVHHGKLPWPVFGWACTCRMSHAACRTAASVTDS